WQAHRDGIFHSLAPVGALEEALAGRVALCSWRLERAARYETAVTAVGLEMLKEQLWSAQPASKLHGLLRDLEEEEGSHPPEAALAKALKKLDEKRDSVEGWEGTLRLFELLPGLADTAPVNGDDVYGLLVDVAGELPLAPDDHSDVEAEGF